METRLKMIEEVLRTNRSADVENDTTTYAEVNARRKALEDLYRNFRKERPLTRKEKRELLSLTEDKDISKVLLSELSASEMAEYRALELEETEERLRQQTLKINELQATIEKLQKTSRTLSQREPDKQVVYQRDPVVTETEEGPVMHKPAEQVSIPIGHPISDIEWKAVCEAVSNLSQVSLPSPTALILPLEGVKVKREKEGAIISNTKMPPDITKMIEATKAAAKALGHTASVVKMSTTAYGAQAILGLYKEPDPLTPILEDEDLNALKKDPSEAAIEAVKVYERIHAKTQKKPTP